MRARAPRIVTTVDLHASFASRSLLRRLLGSLDLFIVYVCAFGRCLACVRDPLCVLCVCPPARPSLLLRGCIPPRQYFYFQEVLAAKQCIMQANAELHQSVLAKQKKRFGEEISRLQVRRRQPLPFLISMVSARVPSHTHVQTDDLVFIHTPAERN